MFDKIVTQNKHKIVNSDSFLDSDASAAGSRGNPRGRECDPYLTRTNNFTTTPVKNDPEILSRSKSLLDELKVESVLDPTTYNKKFRKGFVRCRKSGDYVECYENPNPCGNSLCALGLNKFQGELIESNSENARFSSCSRLTHIIQANPQLNRFFTGTFDPKKWVRSDFKGFYVPFRRFLYHKGIKHILVPEFHADGENIHLHGLFDSSIDPFLEEFDLSKPLPLFILKAIERGDEIFNFPDYQKRFGWVSVSRVKDQDAVAHYVSKYILKSIQDSECRIAHRRFYCSTGLNRPEFLVPTTDDLCALEPNYYSAKIVKVYAKSGDSR